MKCSIEECKFVITSKSDKQTITEFLERYFFVENPFYEALMCLSDGFLRNPTIDEKLMSNIDEGISVMAVTPNEEVVGFIHNVELQSNDGKADYSKINLTTENKQLLDLIRHVETELNGSKNGGREMEVISITTHQNWRCKEMEERLLNKTMHFNRARLVVRRKPATSAYVRKELVGGKETGSKEIRIVEQGLVPFLLPSLTELS
ncbi:hypothetical protein FQA39_LY10642 [Lamprigera yunnana]|nr:hypothetical protein FQA39_LY10642 [Lamprigera yunnana]